MQYIFLHPYSWYTFCRVFSVLVNLDLNNDKDNVTQDTQNLFMMILKRLHY